jgi:hypothetical protein
MGIWTILAWFSRRSAPAYQLDSARGRGKVYMFVGHRYGEVVARDVGLGPPEHPAPSLG